MGLGRLLQHEGAHRQDAVGLTLDHPRGYELCGAVCFAGLRPRAYWRLAALSGARPGDAVLDVGSGTGYLSRRMARTVGPGGTVVGVDPSESLVAYARRRTREPGCSYDIGVAQQLPYEDGRFDVAVTSLAVHHIPEEVRAEAMREIHRVLRPGGRLLVADFRPPRSRLLRHAVSAATAPEMAHNAVDALDRLVADAGFGVRGSGDVRPWLRYVQGVREGD
ncbi:class I SAM-dependent methyltransferase [Streptomyces sp. VRA16 Mangrove soil]|uniref:class I SAM-dependent methyltransferase n=1 Tax=Streptomyces sp. VRA16 Mangrove soil TaxID=2817434 RepID=UPI001A9F5A96|nr:methyltransferase domain-containing protein [Streptomyces sp. VRA16 Mangrove soil]MBO1334520.1 methyltransferase domain-containing protein [Streptomyces sp. VRA16 Mangrove soil]